MDSGGKYNTGEPVSWRNAITLRSRVCQSGDDKMLELRAAPSARMRYTLKASPFGSLGRNGLSSRSKGFDPSERLNGVRLEQTVEYLRSFVTDGEFNLVARFLTLPTGQQLLDYVEETRPRSRAKKFSKNIEPNVRLTYTGQTSQIS